MKLYYIWDAYCGWCYGFDKHLSSFMENHPELEIDMISGGLFAGGNEKTTRELGAFQSMNLEISRRYGVAFGDDFLKTFSQDLEVNSLRAAQAFGVIRNYLPSNELVAFAYRMQTAFYQRGQLLSDRRTYETILPEFGLETNHILSEIEQAWASDSLHPDFIKAQKMGVTSYPTLILEKNGQYFDLRGQAQSSQELEENFQLLKNH